MDELIARVLPRVLPWVLGAVIGAGLASLVWFRLWRTWSAKLRSQARRARSAERLAEIGSLTSGLAHELKNPLSTIALNAQLLGERARDLRDTPDEDKEAMLRRTGTLTRETERLRGILEDFLSFAGEKRVQPAPTDLNTLADELIDFYHPQAERQRLRLRPDLSAEPLIAPLDGSLVKQAVLNLMLNAADAMGEIDDPSHPRELIIRTRDGEDEDRQPVVRLHVIDTGPGIPAEIRDSLFTPYFTTKKGGTGLGLPTTRRIVEEHGGSIEVHSEPGQGTDFVLTFPVRNDGQDEAKA